MKLVKSIGIILIVAASALPMFLSGFFIAGRLIIREVMLDRLEEENAQTVYVPVDDFRWYKQDREIIVGDKMFDVKFMEKLDSVYLITGIFDEMETELNQELEKSSEDTNSNSATHSILQVCLGLIADATGNLLLGIHPDFILLHKSILASKTSLCWTSLEKLYPPPRL